ncbi:MAG: tRNA (adenosine(37)-N6)-threonylcarbamoyltransferase complex dimerization subunit type 1 TsaB [Flavobacteriales bacterium]|jgi:tRNA threonylcarbamoyladenosine biosynthesis protein TsaB|nr:tRNA (adenosine(37)-N6)-threonylcarbamoyltransferase complex dimerization subunit type 1 TsaB [Flavobacteriales bacterium]
MPDKNYILQIDTSTKVCSVAISLNGKTIAHKEVLAPDYSHSELLISFVETALENAQLNKKDLSAIAISQGPGSYTGLRIGASTAKGLAFALKIPLIAIDTLQITATSKTESKTLSVMSARANEVYWAVYKDGICQQSISLETVEESSFKDLKSEKIEVVGNAIDLLKNTLSDTDKWNFNEIPFPYSAQKMSSLAWEKYQKQDFVDLAYFEPMYFKDFVVQRKKK